MGTDGDKAFRDLVNASGFVLQLGLEHAIRESQRSHGWDVVSREHPWSSPEGSGFVDLILSKGIVRLVLECKRVRDGAWVFLAPEDSRPTTGFRCQWAQGAKDLKDLVGWDDFALAPESCEADFCVIRGTGEKDRSLLERIAAGLIESLPSLAIEELMTMAWTDFSTEVIHIPAIVTTADLYICRYSPSEIDLTNGVLNDAKFEKVDYIRFRKSLAHALSPAASIVDIGKIARDKERSVLIVKPTALPSLLEQCTLTARQGWYNAPWVVARRIEKQSSGS
jgi:hypothetical protein